MDNIEKEQIEENRSHLQKSITSITIQYSSSVCMQPACHCLKTGLPVKFLLSIYSLLVNILWWFIELLR